MKRFFTIVAMIFSLSLFYGCSNDDTDELWDSLHSLEKRMDALETVMNAYENNLFIESVNKTDNGYVITFTDGSKAVIENGQDGQDGQDGQGDALIESISISENEVTFHLTDGRSFSIKFHAALTLSFDQENLSLMECNSTREIGYTIESIITQVDIDVISSGDIKAKVKKTTDHTGVIEVKTGAAIDEYSKIVVLVSNGERMIMKNIVFEQAGLVVKEGESLEKTAAIEGEVITLEFLANVDCKATVSPEGTSWITPLPTRAMTEHALQFKIAPNTDNKARSARIIIKAVDFNFELVYTVNQGTDTGFLNIPDPEFKKFLISSKRPQYDLDGDGEISYAEAEQIRELNVPTLKIRSVAGIESMPNLEILQLDGYDYDNYKDESGVLESFDISRNPKLCFLFCCSNPIAEADLSHNPDLHHVELHFNYNLKKLDLSNNPNVSFFSCSSNKQLAEVNVRQCPNLIHLFCNSNPKMTEIDISRCGLLKSFSVNKNPNLKTVWVWEGFKLEDHPKFSASPTTEFVSNGHVLPDKYASKVDFAADFAASGVNVSIRCTTGDAVYAGIAVVAKYKLDEFLAFESPELIDYIDSQYFQEFKLDAIRRMNGSGLELTSWYDKTTDNVVLLDVMNTSGGRTIKYADSLGESYEKIHI